MTALRLIRDDDPRGSRPDLLKGWENFMAAAGMAPATIGVRLRVVRSLMQHAGTDDPLELRRDDVVAWLARPIAAWSRLTYYKSVEKFSQWLREFGHDPTSDLVGGLGKPRTPQPVARPIDDQTVERLLALRLSGRAHTYVRLALYEALRVHEIAKIRGEDFDHEAGWFLVAGKGGVTKPVPIHPEVAKICDRMPEMGFWFPSHQGGGPVSPTAVSATIRQALRLAGSTATAHQLRDTAATRMQRSFKDIRVTQAMLRHRSISSTMKYTEASNEDLRDALRGLDWGDKAQATEPAHVDVTTMTRDQLHELAEQVAAALVTDVAQVSLNTETRQTHTPGPSACRRPPGSDRKP